MSYFAFGLVSLSPSGAARHAFVRDQMARWADASGFTAVLDGNGEPRILKEMRGAVDGDVVLFFCADRTTGNTSEDLLALTDLVNYEMPRGIAAIAAWIGQILHLSETAHVELWLADGFDTEFERWSCAPSELQGLIERRYRDAWEVPWLHVTVSRDAQGAVLLSAD